MRSDACGLPGVDDRGFVLVACLMIMAVLTVIGLAVTRTATVELQIAGNDRFNKEAFFRADAGIFTAPKVITQTLNAGANPNLPAISMIDPQDGTSDANFYRKIMGFDTSAGGIRFALGPRNTSVNITRSGEEALPGGSAEFASGYEGIGHGATGGFAILYTLDASGQAPANARAVIEALYRKVPGTAGGL